jgi:hypothetical protein
MDANGQPRDDQPEPLAHLLYMLEHAAAAPHYGPDLVIAAGPPSRTLWRIVQVVRGLGSCYAVSHN